MEQYTLWATQNRHTGSITLSIYDALDKGLAEEVGAQLGGRVQANDLQTLVHLRAGILSPEDVQRRGAVVIEAAGHAVGLPPFSLSQDEFPAHLLQATHKRYPEERDRASL